MRKFLIAGLLALTSLALIGVARNPDIYFLIKKNFTIFSEVYREVSLQYVDKVDPEKLMRKGINAMLESLDPYTVLVDEADRQNMEILSRGSYGGVGIEVDYRGGDIVVVAPIEGYAAHRKGIRSGDVITRVDGVSVKNLMPEQVQELIDGELGSTVTMTIERYGMEEPLTFELERQRIEVKNVAYAGFISEDKNVGYILLNRFSKGTADEVRMAIDELSAQKELSGVVLDLRNNPGGLLEEAVATVGKFVSEGTRVVETRGRFSQHDNVFATEESPVMPDMPLVVLQNGGSASASEIVAGALQDLDRAVIMGEQSFGKGLVQTVRELSYNTALKMTISRYYIPSGRSIQSVRYTHDDNNSAVMTPDSLRKEFKTRNGRTVYDGNGISPDLIVSDKEPSLLETSLLRQNIFFEFANRYAADNDSLGQPFGADDLYQQFMRFVDEQPFDYQAPSENHLVKVDSLLADAGEKSEEHIQELKDIAARKKEQQFIDERPQLEKRLYLELIARYKGQQGQTAAWLPHDELVNRAVAVLQDENKYNRILAEIN
ncbi:S41 family peptidase [Fodinibius sp. Rm-B-1B1-1]|uniref:S41 family peptidase n=1 Tax=Fodinibius alkaliphilus TaxID=3140241 RepID=UPI00315A3C81